MVLVVDTASGGRSEASGVEEKRMDEMRKGRRRGESEREGYYRLIVIMTIKHEARLCYEFKISMRL